GDRVERSVPVVVTGDGLATIVRSTLTGPFELTTPLPAVARDGAPLPLAITFAPDGAGAFDGRLELETDDGVVLTTRLCGDATRAKLCVTPPVIDLGDVPTDTPIATRFDLASCGDDTLTAISARASTASITLPPVPSTLAVATSTTITVDVLLRSPGEWRGTITIDADTPDAPEILELRANAVPRCDLEVLPSVIVIDNRSEPRPPSRVLLKNRGPNACTLTRIYTPNVYTFRVREGELLPFDLLPGELYEVVLDPDWSIVSTVVEETLVITARGGQTWTVPLFANVRPAGCALELVPAFFNLGVVAPGQTSSRTVDLSVIIRSPTPCDIGDVELPPGTNPALTVTAPTPGLRLPWDSFQVTIHYSPTREEVLDTFVELKIVGWPEPLRIPIRGEALAPRLCVEPDAIDFGRVRGRAERDIRVTACGPEPVTLTRAPTRTAHAELGLAETLPVTLQPGETRVLHAAYSPRDPFVDATTLVLWSDHRQRPRTRIELSGAPDEIDPADGLTLLVSRRIARDELLDVVSLTGAPVTRAPKRSEQLCTGCHSMSPDGRYLAFVERNETAPYDSLFIRDLDTGEVSDTGIREVTRHVSWRPNVDTSPPHQFVYTDARRVLSIGAVGRGFVRDVGVVDDADQVHLFPSWGPRGEIAFIRVARANASLSSILRASALAVVHEDGGPIRVLVGADGSQEVRTHPEMSPDGTWIAFTEESVGLDWTSELRAVRVDDGALVQLPRINASVPRIRGPTWSRTGRFLTFRSDLRMNGPFGLYIAPFDAATGLDGPASRISELDSAAEQPIRVEWRP
ncbi:choice-of-anchor D domain-containing protein, partial [Myxococcota bacterium]|nr:choice-of-anchor D domain-containing protein [Myxococcota bacterium]